MGERLPGGLPRGVATGGRASDRRRTALPHSEDLTHAWERAALAGPGPPGSPRGYGAKDVSVEPVRPYSLPLATTGALWSALVLAVSLIELPVLVAKEASGLPSPRQP
jgi:hypothetical protein